MDAWVDTGQDFMDDSGGFEMGVEGSGILKPASAPHKLLGEFSEISFMYSFVGAMHMEFLLPDNVFKDNILLGTRIFGQIWPFLTNWNFISTSQVNDQICNFFYFSFLTLQMTIGSFGSFFFFITNTGGNRASFLVHYDDDAVPKELGFHDSGSIFSPMVCALSELAIVSKFTTELTDLLVYGWFFCTILLT